MVHHHNYDETINWDSVADNFTIVSRVVKFKAIESESIQIRNLVEKHVLDVSNVGPMKMF